MSPDRHCGTRRVNIVVQDTLIRIGLTGGGRGSYGPTRGDPYECTCIYLYVKASSCTDGSPTDRPAHLADRVGCPDVVGYRGAGTG